eukprot:scaffold74988_cov41-Prasinocladus_malaysianus.AAC.1
MSPAHFPPRWAAAGGGVCLHPPVTPIGQAQPPPPHAPQALRPGERPRPPMTTPPSSIIIVSMRQSRHSRPMGVV